MGTVEHYTPPYIVEAARELMGEFDLDPASCELANRMIKAKEYYTENGLEKPWFGKVFLNPPGGKLKGKSQQALFYERLVKEWMFRRVKEAFFVSFNIELVRTAQSMDVLNPLQLMYCIPKKRIRFWHENEQGSLVEGTRPTHCNLLLYLQRDMASAGRFKSIMGEIGICP